MFHEASRSRFPPLRKQLPRRAGVWALDSTARRKATRAAYWGWTRRLGLHPSFLVSLSLLMYCHFGHLSCVLIFLCLCCCSSLSTLFNCLSSCFYFFLFFLLFHCLSSSHFFFLSSLFLLFSLSLSRSLFLMFFLFLEPNSCRGPTLFAYCNSPSSCFCLAFSRDCLLCAGCLHFISQREIANLSTKVPKKLPLVVEKNTC